MEVKFGAEVPGANAGDEPVVNDPKIEEDGGRITVTVTPEQAEAIKKMMAEGGDEGDKPKEEEKPEWLGAFKSPEEMARAYQELRAKMSKGEKPEEADKATPKVDESKLDMTKYSSEFDENGALSDESYKELADKGYDREFVDTYIAGRQAQIASAKSTLFEAAGGEESYAQVLEWGKANLPSHAQKAYDRLLDSGDFQAAALAMRGFVQAYVEANGSDPRGVEAGSRSQSSGVQPFTNKTDMVKAINDPRYKNGDKAYVAEVERRIHASRF